MTRKCTIAGCPSRSGSPQHRGVTFHGFPYDQKIREIWISNCRIAPEKNITKNVVVCSRHFRRVDFQPLKSNKFLLKQGSVPTIFPWSKVESSTNDNQKTATSSESDANTSEQEQNPSTSAMEVNDDNAINTSLSTTAENDVLMNFQTPKRPHDDDPDDEDSISKMPKLIFEDSSPEKPNTSDFQQVEKSIKNSNSLLNSPELTSHQRKPETPGSPVYTVSSKIEAQDFNGVWHSAKIIEIDSDEKEVLIRFEKSRKSKGFGTGGGGGIEEWIPMNSSRLRLMEESQKKPPPIFELGEKCTAKWSGPRKFPAIVTKILGNDSYEVLFEDGLSKVVKGNHMSKIKQKSMVTTSSKSPPSTSVKTKSSKKDWPLISMSSLNLEELNLKEIPKDGEWCCHWVNDQPIGQEGFLMVGDHKKPTVIVEDWRLPPNWIKHMYQRSNVLGKWDVILVSPQGKRFRSKADLKLYIEEMGQVYNPDVYDFSIHRRRAKDIGAYVYTKDYKPPPPPVPSSHQYFAQIQQQQQEQEQNANTSADVTVPILSPSHTSSTNMTEQSITPAVSAPKDEENLTPTVNVTAKGKSVEDGYVYVGSLKVKIVDNLFRCPQDGCNKNFRKENHLQIHVKHYHRDLAKLLGVCPNMQDLAYKRTVIGTTIDEPLPKNHLPNVQFFAKLHQQDLANRTHRKSTTSTPTHTTHGDNVIPSNQDPDVQPLVSSPIADANKKDTPEIIETDQKSNDTTENNPLTSTPNVKPAPLITEEEHATGDSTPSVFVKEESTPKLIKTSSKIRKSTIKNFPTNVGRRSARQKLTRKYIQSSNITSSTNTGNTTNNSTLLDTTFGVSDQEETRHSFSGGNSSIEIPTASATTTTTTSTSSVTTKSTKKITIKPEPLFIISEQNLDANSQSQTTTGSIQDQSQSPKYINENGEIIKIVRMRQEEIINCLCNYCEEDGLMIQCELCLCWQHGICNGIEKESQVPEKYICYICRNPQRGRTSLKYIHDQDWMYEGKLPVAQYHALNPDLYERFEILRKTHILTGNLLELKRFMHSLKVKINIAENKDHPKMYLWTNKWETTTTSTTPIKDSLIIKSSNNNNNIKKTEEINDEINKKESSSNNDENNDDDGNSGGGGDGVDSNDNEKKIIDEKTTIKNEKNNDNDKKILQTIDDIPAFEIMKQPTIPQPEAPIDPVECQRRLLEHIKIQQSCVMDRLQTIESQIMELESLDDSETNNDPNDDDYSKTKETIAMYIKDLETMKNIAKINTVQVQPNFITY